MAEHKTTTCDQCGAIVIDALSLSGLRPMPVDPFPSRDGTIQLRETGGDRPLAVTLVTAHQRFGKTLYTKHTTSCSRRSSPTKRARS